MTITSCQTIFGLNSVKYPLDSITFCDSFITQAIELYDWNIRWYACKHEEIPNI